MEIEKCQLTIDYFPLTKHDSMLLWVFSPLEVARRVLWFFTGSSAHAVGNHFLLESPHFSYLFFTMTDNNKRKNVTNAYS